MVSVSVNLPTLEKDLLALAKSKGARKIRKDTKTGNEVDINLYVYQHEDGVLLAYENATTDKELDEEVSFELKGLKIDENPSANKLSFIVGPQRTKIIKLSKTSIAFAISYSVSYLTRPATAYGESGTISNITNTTTTTTNTNNQPNKTSGGPSINPELKKKAQEQGTRKQRKETKTNKEVEIFQSVLQHDDGVFILYENRTKDFALDEELTFEMTNLSLEENPGKTSVKFDLQPGCERAIKLVKTGPAFAIKYGMSYSVKFVGEGSFGAARLPEHELIKLAKEKGQVKQRKDNKSGEMVDIILRVLQHEQGVFMLYENNTKNLELEEEIKFELKGLQLAHDPKCNSLKVTLKPGETRSIIIDSTSEENSISYNVSYMIKNC